VGDGLGYEPDGSRPFRINRQRTTTQIVFLSHAQYLLYTFSLRNVSSLNADVKSDDWEPGRLGDLFTYEVAPESDDLLHIGFLFASGATIEAKFRRLIFRRKRIKRQYPSNEMYA